MPHKDPIARRRKHTEYLRKRYREDPVYKAKHLVAVKRNNTKHRKAAYAMIAEFKKDGCICCGEKEICCLDTHHKDPDKKEFQIGAGAIIFGLPKLKAELAKCICLCANCHRKVHAGIINL